MTTSSDLLKSQSDNNGPKHDDHGVTLKDSSPLTPYLGDETETVSNPPASSSPSVRKFSDDNEWEYVPKCSSGHSSSENDQVIEKDVNSHGDMATTRVLPLQWAHKIPKGDRLISETSNKAVQSKPIEEPNHAKGSVLDKATQTEGMGEGSKTEFESHSQRSFHDEQPPNYKHATSAFVEGTSRRGVKEKEGESSAAVGAELPVPLLQAIASYRDYGLSHGLVDTPSIIETDLQRDWTAILDQFEHAQSIWQPGTTPTGDVLKVFDQLQFNMFMIVGGAPERLRSAVTMRVGILYRLPHLGRVERKVIVGEEIGSPVLNAEEKAFPFIHTYNKRPYSTTKNISNDAKTAHQHHNHNGPIENIAEDTSTKAQFGK